MADTELDVRNRVREDLDGAGGEVSGPAHLGGDASDEFLGEPLRWWLRLAVDHWCCLGVVAPVLVHLRDRRRVGQTDMTVATGPDTESVSDCLESLSSADGPETGRPGD